MKATGSRVLIKVLPVEERSSSGLTFTLKRKQTIGEVLQLGSADYEFETQVGDIVILPTWDNMPSEVVLFEKDLFMIITA